jgi:hypothetical protein
MTTFTEGRHPGEFILSEAEFGRSRDNLTVAVSQTITPGQLLGGKVTVADATTAVSAAAGNTASSGTIAVGTPAITSKAKDGRYKGVAATATTVRWEDPDGVEVGTSTHGTEFSKGGIKFTVTAGGTPNVAGDTFYFDVGVEPGDVQHVAYNQDGTDGSEVIRGIAIYGVTTGAGATAKIAGLSRDAQVKGVALTLPGDVTAAERAAAYSQLSKLGIIVR